MCAINAPYDQYLIIQRDVPWGFASLITHETYKM